MREPNTKSQGDKGSREERSFRKKACTHTYTHSYAHTHTPPAGTYAHIYIHMHTYVHTQQAEPRQNPAKGWRD